MLVVLGRLKMASFERLQRVFRTGNTGGGGSDIPADVEDVMLEEIALD